MAPHDILLNETDRTVALVIAYIDTRLGAKILARFEPERQSKIIRHIIEFRPDDLPEELEYQKYIPFEKIGGVDFVGELLEVLDQAEWQVILEDISQNVPELANKTRQRILAFEDIAQFRDCNVQCLLKNIETMQWAVALQGTSEELKNRIFANMSKRAVLLLKEEIEYLGSVPLSSIKQVRREIIRIVRLLINSGEIDWSPT